MLDQREPTGWDILEQKQMKSGREIIAEVAEKNALTVDDLKGQDRTRHVAWPRQAAMAKLHDLGWSYPRIGQALGRDHSTTLYGVREFRKRRNAGLVDEYGRQV